MLLKDKTSFYKVCFDSMQIGILVFNQERKIVLANQPLADLLGVDEVYLLQHKIDAFFKHTEIFKAYIQNPEEEIFKSTIELEEFHANGSSIFLELNFGKMVYEGELYFKALISDISLRKLKEVKITKLNVQLEEEVRIRNLKLEEAVIQLKKTLNKEKELNSLKTKFITLASHEFKTPLSAILSSTELMAKYANLLNTGKLNEHLQKVKMMVNRLNGMLDDLLTLENIETGQVSTNFSHFNYNDLIQEIIIATKPHLKKNQTINIEKSDLKLIYHDFNILKIILTNLLYNAIKFSKENSEIFLKISSSKSNLHLSVKDSGIGIPKAEQGFIFTQFFRAKNAIYYPGTGIGLNIIKGYINRFKGDIKFTSVENEGSVFIIKLPKIKEL
ncbi:PAS domain S-box-containing protein [Lutibacter agarilyticus]|uniref:histidine kinase n=1 Tax=Lutibacter agarilyticus TaxID=1109740 RepID=A0A238VIP2_9FLAO|nr:PAS domain-containing sensor histidine kinase [Lutibacter agarilyticus]SNR34096.1 PAS domain S-box-containing protein [Lutibacter agarilyticus]